MNSSRKIYVLIGAIYISLALALLQTYEDTKYYVELIVFILNTVASIFAIYEFLLKRKN
ncbi:MAG: hypothetical protein KBA66_13885 [Leptospiraceae bacterium]|nr:hypothetical protein [Leptospiraceae bacterium]